MRACVRVCANGKKREIYMKEDVIGMCIVTPSNKEVLSPYLCK